MAWQEYIPKDIADLYEVQDYTHAAAILSKEFPKEFQELCHALRSFSFTINDILTGGGNESNIPKIFSDILRPMNWCEKNLEAELNVYEVKNSRDKNL